MKRRILQLRRDAEAQLSRAPKARAPGLSPQQVLHELQVHEIELQMQNEELRRTQLELEEARDRYLDLYESAPVGYLTLSVDGVVLGINLTGAKWLGEDRKKILRRRFSRFIASEDCDRYHSIFKLAIEDGARRTLSLDIRRSDNTLFYAQLDCMRAAVDHIAHTVRITVTDITEHKRAEAEIETPAFYDSLTKLPNRRLLLDRLQKALAACPRTLHRGAVLLIDLDEFKILNDTLGHDTGDLLLQQIAHRLTCSVRMSDTVARLECDEFVVLLQGLSRDSTTARAEATAVGDKLLATLNGRYILSGRECRSTGSIGITLFGENRDSAEEVLKRADLALYRAKSAGHSMLRFFDPEMQATLTSRALLESELLRAIQEKQLVLYYQPQVDQDGVLTGAEGLLRWQHPRRGLLPPSEFIPFAEEHGMIAAVGEWVLKTACKQLIAWSHSPETSHLTISINVSAQEFHHPDFVPGVLAVVDDLGADPRSLIMEFTERAVLDPVDETVSKMLALKARDVRFSLDDFGIGYSSLLYLKDLPLDQLKIDRAFIRLTPERSSHAALARAIMALGHALGLTVIAEGVETEEQREFLASHGCRAFQGFLFGRPVPVGELL